MWLGDLDGRPRDHGFATLEGGDVMPVGKGVVADRHGRAHVAPGRHPGGAHAVQGRRGRAGDRRRACRAPGPRCTSTPCSRSATATWSRRSHRSSTRSCRSACAPTTARRPASTSGARRRADPDASATALGVRLPGGVTGGDRFGVHARAVGRRQQRGRARARRRHRLRPQHPHQHGCCARRASRSSPSPPASWAGAAAAAAA